MSAADILRHARGDRLDIVARPGAPRTEALGWDEARQALKVTVAAPPEDGKANLELVKFFSRLLRREVTIARGATGRKKTLLLGPARGPP